MVSSPSGQEWESNERSSPREGRNWLAVLPDNFLFTLRFSGQCVTTQNTQNTHTHTNPHTNTPYTHIHTYTYTPHTQTHTRPTTTLTGTHTHTQHKHTQHI